MVDGHRKKNLKEYCEKGNFCDLGVYAQEQSWTYNAKIIERMSGLDLSQYYEGKTNNKMNDWGFVYEIFITPYTPPRTP